MLTDTREDSKQMQYRLLMQMTPEQRLQLAANLTSEVIHASKNAIARLNPEYTSREIENRFIELHYGKALALAVNQELRKRSHV